MLAAVLALQGLATLGWAWRTRAASTGTDVVTAAPDDPVADEISTGWKIGAAHLVAAGWIGAALAQADALEAWTLPLAPGLLVVPGPRLRAGGLLAGWGPGLRGRRWRPRRPGRSSSPNPGLAAGAGARRGRRSRSSSAARWRARAARGGRRRPPSCCAGPGRAGAAVAADRRAGRRHRLLAVGTLREWRPVAGFRLRLAELR